MDKREFQRHIGQRIKALRESKNISQSQLAAMCNFEKSNMNRLEAGNTNPTAYTLYKIAQNLRVSLSQITDVISSS